MIEIKDYQIAQPLLKLWQHDLMLRSLNQNRAQTRIWVDNDEEPTCAVVLIDLNIRIIGFPTPATKREIEQFFTEIIKGNVTGLENNVAVYCLDSRWEESILSLSRNLKGWKNQQSFYTLSLEGYENAPVIDGDVQILDVKTALADPDLSGCDILKDDIAAICNNNHYFEHEFGFCAIRNGEVVGYFLSDFSFGTGCFLTATLFEDDEKIKQALLKAFVNEGILREYSMLVFTCNSLNHTASTLASSLGFEKAIEQDYLYLEY